MLRVLIDSSHFCCVLLPCHPLAPLIILQVARLEAALRVSSVEKQQLQQRLQQEVEDLATTQQEADRAADGLRVQLAAKDVLHR